MERRTRALEQYKDFFESSSDGMLVVDSQGSVLYVNRAAEQLTGYARGGLILKPISEIVAPAHREGLQTVIEQLVRGISLESFDLQLVTTSGEKLTVSMASSSVLAEHGAAILAFRDVTEARALEAELRKTKDFLEQLIDSAVDAIVAADMRGNVIIFNQGAARLTGYSPDEVLGKIPVWSLYRWYQCRWRRRSSTRAGARSRRSESSAIYASASKSSNGSRRRRSSCSRPRNKRSSPSWPARPRTS
jgi:PAS domain S-box-containing protein